LLINFPLGEVVRALRDEDSATERGRLSEVKNPLVERLVIVGALKKVGKSAPTKPYKDLLEALRFLFAELTQRPRRDKISWPL